MTLSSARAGRFMILAVGLLSLPLIAAAQGDLDAIPAAGPVPANHPTELALTRASSVTFDVRKLPAIAPTKLERPELEDPEPNPVTLGGRVVPETNAPVAPPVRSAAAPAPIASFDGLDFATWGAGHPPDTNGDVGPTYYIQTVNTSIGIYSKTGGAPVAAFTFNTFMSQGTFGNLCDTDNFGDPVVLYDSFEDRWIITDFAFTLSGGNVVAPVYECFAASKTGDPVSGGWNFYSVQVAGALGDYPKLAIWPDGVYMSANLFSLGAGSAFQNPRVWAINKAQMYAGAPTVQVVTFDAPAADFTILPSNARLQTGTPPAGTPNYFVSTWQFLNALTVYKFHVDWDRISASTFTGPDAPLATTSWPNAAVANAPSSGGNALDVLQIRAMVQNQYTNIGGVESLWTTHTVRRGNTSGFAAPRWYQVDVTGGTVGANLPQAATWDPDGANVLHRFVPSVAVDRAGDLALGYSTSSSTTKPAIMYAGRLAGDPVNTFSQTEQLLIQGTGTQTGTCGGVTCIRWGDYAAMTLDPDGCTFWYTNEYYAIDGLNNLTRIGSFAYPSCTPVGAGGTLSGTVTAVAGGAPISGATVILGSRTTTTDGSGFYSFSIPAGTYPHLTVVDAGFTSGTASSLVVTDGNTTTQNFALAAAPTSACPTDTTQSDFQRGAPTNVDLNVSPGDVVLGKPSLDQQNETLGTSGVGITITTWGGQTFTPAVSGLLTAADVNLFCSGCTGTTPNLTLSLRATSGGLPTGADLATATITGFGNGGVASYFHATFSPQVALTAGTMYALVIRPTANPSPGTYALTRSGTSTAGANVYAGGTRVAGATSGTVWSIPLTGGVSTDAGFRTFMDSGYVASGNLVSGLIDSNPGSGLTPIWTTLSWTATVPANTTLQFQVAASNSPTGPFNFVGPDSTAATFFTTSGASLNQFTGFRFLQYKALLATTDSTATPTLNDVTICFNNVPPPDVSITKTDGVTTATPGGSVTYTITASNPSPLAANPVTVADTFPASLTCTWTCVGAGGGTCTASGSGNINDTVNLPGGASVTYTATCAISASATGSLSNTATVTFAGDPNAANDSATDTDTLTPQADLAITKTDGVTTATPGGSVTYTITASNAGPSNASGATAADTFPASLTCTWTCVGAGGGTCTASGSGSVNDTVNLPAGGSVTYTASCTISAAATGTLSNTATVAAPAGVTDPTPGNNSATDTDTLSASADLAITKTDGVTTSTPGGSVTYTITASNAGPSNAPGSTVADTFPASLTCTWTCVGAGGGTCTASGSGNVNDTVNLPAGGSVTYTASCTINAAATGTLSNTATVAAPAGVTDPTPGNNSATDTDTLSASADLAITKTDGVTTATPGGSVTYTITASNAGPSNAPGSTVADTFPASLTCTWTCVGAGGGTCTASGSGNVNDTVNLPAGGSVTYTASCTINAAATGTLSNTATVAAPGGVTDPTPGNNSATDTDTLGAALTANVTGTKTVAGSFTPGGTITYTVTLTNSGTGAQGDNPGNELTDVLPSGLTLVSANASSGTAVATVGTHTVTWNGGIPASGSVTITITATVNAGTGGATISNQGSIAYDNDGNGTNESSRLTDDPGVAGAADPTSFTVVAASGAPLALDKSPGATLLLPYFEVDFSNPGGITTLLSLNNAAPTAVLAHVTLWTDLGVPTLGFNVYLTGYDVQTINIRDLFNGGTPGTPTASLGQDPADTISPKGALSQDIDFASCAGMLPVPPVDSIPTLIPGVTYSSYLRAAHTGAPSAFVGNLCSGQALGDNIGRGYLTIDTVNNCTSRHPGDPGYFGAGGTGDASNQNVLWGDYFIINPAQNFLQGDAMVSIKAAPGIDIHNQATPSDPTTTTSGRYTFYGRYVNWTAIDNRQPLATHFASRFFHGGTFNGGTNLIVWRDSKVNQGPFACPATAGRPSWYPLAQDGLVVFDEQEHPVLPSVFYPPLPAPVAFPAATQRTQVGSTALPVPYNAGWMFLDLNTTIAGVPDPPVDPAAAQAWVTSVFSANGQFSIGFAVTHLDSASAPLHFVP